MALSTELVSPAGSIEEGRPLAVEALPPISLAVLAGLGGHIPVSLGLNAGVAASEKPLQLVGAFAASSTLLESSRSADLR